MSKYIIIEIKISCLYENAILTNEATPEDKSKLIETKM